MTKTANNPTPPLSQWRQVRNQAIRLLADRLGNSPARVAALRLPALYRHGKVLCWIPCLAIPLDYETREAIRQVRPPSVLRRMRKSSAAFGKYPDSYYPLSPRQIARILKSASSADKKTESVKSVVKKEIKGGLNGQ
jgi:hypothetical protein